MFTVTDYIFIRLLVFQLTDLIPPFFFSFRHLESCLPRWKAVTYFVCHVYSNLTFHVSHLILLFLVPWFVR